MPLAYNGRKTMKTEGSDCLGPSTKHDLATMTFRSFFCPVEVRRIPNALHMHVSPGKDDPTNEMLRYALRRLVGGKPYIVGNFVMNLISSRSSLTMCSVATCGLVRKPLCLRHKKPLFPFSVCGVCLVCFLCTKYASPRRFAFDCSLVVLGNSSQFFATFVMHRTHPIRRLNL